MILHAKFYVFCHAGAKKNCIEFLLFKKNCVAKEMFIKFQEKKKILASKKFFTLISQLHYNYKVLTFSLIVTAWWLNIQQSVVLNINSLALSLSQFFLYSNVKRRTPFQTIEK